jgi:hypothetical protein
VREIDAVWMGVLMGGPPWTDKQRMPTSALRETPLIAGAVYNSPGALLAEVHRLYQQLIQLPRLHRPEQNTARRPTAAYLALEAQIRGLAERYRSSSAGPGPARQNRA